MLCGARNRDGSQCRAFPVRGSGRCKWHGGMSTGPITIEGKRRCYAAGIGAWLAAGGRPHRGPNRSPAERARIAEAKLRRRKAWGERRDRKRERQAHKERQRRIAMGLPAFTDSELSMLDQE
jgi:hypothetical protein